MKKMLLTAVSTLAVLAVLVVVAALAATARWNRVTEQARVVMMDQVRGPERPDGPAEGGDSLPPPVARFLHRSAPTEAGTILRSTLVQEGRFQMSEGEAGWRPFTANQHARAYPPGFLWDATIAMAPGVPVRVRDGYIDGQGMMQGAILSLITVVRAEATPELSEGALYRYLAEAPWMPTRLRPGDGLTWQPQDDSTAVATLTDGDLHVSVYFRFDDAGDVVGIHVPERGREVEGTYVPSPWQGRFWDHQEVAGFRVPMQGEVAWVVDGVVVPYWTGRLTSVSFVTHPAG